MNGAFDGKRIDFAGRQQFGSMRHVQRCDRVM
ncbi:hypothetical protein X751_29515 [Mesorhizobium sp. LNJC395A00]|nr:hypothetical protein X751_29515 [Mesorhizobium sp. LNJC395A00]